MGATEAQAVQSRDAASGSDAARFRLVLDVFCAVVDADPSERTKLLEQLTQNDPTVREQVERMLAQEAGASGTGSGSGILQTGAGAQAAARAAEGPEAGSASDSGSGIVFGTDEQASALLASLPRISGHYQILRQIGEGGMGVVYEAEQSFPKRRVAIKAIKPGMLSHRMLARFEAEAHILGRLHHPGIAQIHEAGVVDRGPLGQLFLVMEFVEGRTITEFARTRCQRLAQKLELMTRVCSAVNHAHLRGVIHRDLKPANILVTEDGQPKVLDFGIARTTDRHDHEPQRTEQGQLIGTLAYMSPEQLCGEHDQIDVRSDVYALGVVLFQLIAGRLPVEVAGLGFHETLSKLSRSPHARLRSVAPGVSIDVETVAARACDPDLARRYQSVSELEDDLRRCIEGKPIAARRDNTLYVLGKLASRHRVPVALAGAALAAIVFFAFTAYFSSLRNAELARRVGTALGSERSARLALDAEAMRLRQSLYASSIGFAQAAALAGDGDRMRSVLAQCPPDLRNWEWRYLDELSDRSSRVVNAVDTGWSWMSIDRSRGLVLVSQLNGQVSAHDLRTGEFRWRVWLPGNPGEIAVSPSGDAWYVPLTLEGLAPIDPDSGALLPERFPLAFAPRKVCFSPDGQRILLTLQQEGLWIFDRRTKELTPLSGAPDDLYYNAIYSPDGALLAASGERGDVYLMDATDGTVLRTMRGHEGTVNSVAFSRDGTRLASAGTDRTSRVWDVASGREVCVDRGHSNKVFGVSFSPDGRHLAAGGTASTLRITTTTDGSLVTELLGHQSRVQTVLFVDDTTVLSQAIDGTVRWWSDVLESAPAVRRIDPTNLYSGRFDPSRRWALLTRDHRIELLDIQRATVTDSIEQSLPMITKAIWTTQGGQPAVLYAAADGTLVRRRVDLERGTFGAAEASPPLFDDYATFLSLSPDEREIVAADDKGVVRFIDATSFEVRAASAPLGATFNAMAFIPRTDLMAIGGSDGVLRFVDVRTAALVREAATRFLIIYGIVAREDGQLFVAPEDYFACQIDAATGREVKRFVGHKGPLYSTCLSPDGRRLFTGSHDNTVRIWDTQDGSELLALRGHTSSVIQMALTPNQERLLTLGWDGAIRLWDAPVASTPAPRGLGSLDMRQLNGGRLNGGR